MATARIDLNLPCFNLTVTAIGDQVLQVACGELAPER